MANKQVTLEGRGLLTLHDNDHIATGGQGSAYKAGQTVVKLYTDPATMQQGGMIERLRRLSTLNDPSIVAPRGLVFNDKQVPVGYYMDLVTGEPFAKMFTNDFRQRLGFSDENTSTLVDGMRSTMQFAHAHAVCMVDPNELNWMAVLQGKTGPEPRIFDTDSWVFDGETPTTVPKMPSIRDWHGHLVSRESDRFAWAIVSFQLYTGIHPYKGTLDGYRLGELERRMKDKASVFTPGIRLNIAVRDFSCIPSLLREWYEVTFQTDKRSVPPSPFDKRHVTTKAAQVKRITSTASGKLEFHKLFDGVSDPVIRVFPCGAVLLKSGKLIDHATKRTIGVVSSSECEVVTADRGWLIADRDGNGFVFSYTNAASLVNEKLTLPAKGYRIVRYENRMFVITDQGLTELKLMMFAKPILALGKSWGVMINSTRWFDGVGIQDALGATFVVAPFGTDSVMSVRVKELDGLTPVAAKSGNRFVCVIAMDNKTGQYVRIELTFAKDYSGYTLWQGGAATPDLNMAFLPKGVGATIVDDGELVIFVPTNGAVKKVPDKDIVTDMLLGNWEDKVVYIRNGALWSLTLKP